ncbi:MAG: hypothetical protein ABSD50_07810 [Smithella sp.]
MTDDVLARMPVAQPVAALTEAFPGMLEVQAEATVTSMDVPSL